MFNNTSLEDEFNEVRSQLNAMIASSESLETGPMYLRYGVSTKPHDRAIQFDNIINHAIVRLESILNDDEDIPLILPWIPKTTDNEVISHCRNLNIPKLYNKPCLLLHELGRQDGTALNRHIPDVSNGSQLEQWRGRDESLRSIFLPEKGWMYHSTLINTSGSGKTRLVLEGLCSEWGFYFTCRRREDEIGSSDIQAIIGEAGCFEAQNLARELPVLPSKTSLNSQCMEARTLEEALRRNERIADRCFGAAMVARLLVFSCFLNAAVKHRNIDPNLLKKTWLFVQLDTRLLGNDLLKELTCVLSTIENVEVLSGVSGYLFHACKQALLKLDDRATLYCVVDAAQTAEEAWSNSFRDSFGKNDRPALHAMLSCWRNRYDLRMIVTGRPMNHRLIMEALSSTLARPATFSRVNSGVTSTGSWANDTTITAYLKTYLPRSYLQSPSGRELLERACYWLWGRPQFVAAYVQLVIENDFRSYHRLLSQCVQSISGFIPTDGVDWENQEPDVATVAYRLCPFDYERVSKIKHQLLDSMQSMTYERLMSGTLDFGRTVDNWDLVGCGFARYPGATVENGDPLFDEPLACLAADIWINSQDDSWKQRHEFFMKQIGNKGPTANGLECYTLLVLAEAFRDFNKLSNVFEFVPIGIDRDLAEQRARLVSCWYDSSDTFRVTPSSYPIETKFHGEQVMQGPSSPCRILGYRAPTHSQYEGNLEWLAGRNRVPFLFPMEQLGPDIMFRLQLEQSREIITVALQVQDRAASSNFSEAEIRDALRSVTPQYFWKDVDGNAKGPHNLLQNTAHSLFNFPGRFSPNESGYGSVLRAIFVFPAEANAMTCTRIKDVAVKLQHDTSSRGLGDLHDICVMPTSKLLGLKGPIEKGLRIILEKARRPNQEDREHKADIISHLRLSGLSRLKSAELGYQLFLHHELEAIRAMEGDPAGFLTPDPYGMKRQERYAALRSAVQRYKVHEERLRARRQGEI